MDNQRRKTERQRKRISKLLKFNGFVFFVLGIIMVYFGGTFVASPSSFFLVPCFIFIGGSIPGILLFLTGNRFFHFSTYLRTKTKEINEVVTLKELYLLYWDDFPLRQEWIMGLLVFLGLWLLVVVGTVIDSW